MSQQAENIHPNESGAAFLPRHVRLQSAYLTQGHPDALRPCRRPRYIPLVDETSIQRRHPFSHTSLRNVLDETGRSITEVIYIYGDRREILDFPHGEQLVQKVDDPSRLTDTIPPGFDTSERTHRLVPTGPDDCLPQRACRR